MKENKGLSDMELAAKYETGAIDLAKVIKESLKEYKPVKGIVTERDKKETINLLSFHLSILLVFS